jgi:hypothetical protein
LRLAFHDAGEIDITQTDKLGPDGCLSNTLENAGLIPFGSVTSTIFDQLFEPIFQNYCDTISLADFWAMIGWLSINIASAGGIEVQYQYGRVYGHLPCSDHPPSICSTEAPIYEPSLREADGAHLG